AHRLLLQRKDQSILPQLKSIVKESDRPESRVRALWLLDSLEGLHPEILRQAMSDEKAGVRENAVMLSRELLDRAETLKKSVIQACGDENMRVRFQCALALGDAEGPGVMEALAALATRDGENRWMRAAVLSGIGGRMGGFLQHLQGHPSAHTDSYALVMEDLARIF